MTRINLVDPTELMDQHLIAEYREIRLLCANLTRTLNSKSGFVEKKVPDRFTLNKGHVYFFYNKGKYLHKRFVLIKDEMRRRGFAPKNCFPREVWPDELYNDWKPSAEDIAIIRKRIKERINAKPHWYRHSGRQP